MQIPYNIQLRKRGVKSLKISDFILISLVPISVLALALLLSSSTYAETSTKTSVSVEVKQGCNVTAANNEHTGSISNGTYSTIGDPTEFTIACNGNNKYDIYAIGYTGDTEGNNKLVGDKDSDNKYNIATGTAQSGDASNWAFKLSEPSEGLTLEPTYGSNFAPIPGQSQKVASRVSSTLNNTKDTFKSTYAAYISKSQPADTYHGKVKYTLMDQGTTTINNYSIEYKANGGDESSLPSPNPQTGSTLDTTITLSDATPTKDGYEFVGWCSTNPGESDTCPEGGKSYEVGGSYSLNDGIKITLYATWQSLLPTMQDFQCNTLNSGASTTLRDSRDGNEYTVAKLKDNKCWMIDNLRLGDSKLTAKNSSRTLTSADTNITGTYSLPTSSSTGFDDNTNKALVYVPDSEYYDYEMEYGGYYSWYAATAGTGSSATTEGDQASSSICPKGWSLPTGNTGGEFCGLVEVYGGKCENTYQTDVGSLLIAKPIPNFVGSGYYHHSSPVNQGSNGFWWSSTAKSSTYVYSFSVRGGRYVYPLDAYDRDLGLTVRCVARQ